MPLSLPTCYRNEDGAILSPCCNCSTVKNGFTASKKQRYRCRKCSKSFQIAYRYRACQTASLDIAALMKEGTGIRSISRLLRISVVTVLTRIKKLAAAIIKPVMKLHKSYEMDELRTYIQTKDRPVWVAYAMRRDTGEVADFVVGGRSNKTLKKVVDTLLLSKARTIHTDRLSNYAYLIPKEQHKTKVYGINHIERKNLTLRTHLKRLGRRTIAFSKSKIMLAASLKIYFWG